MKSNQTHRCTKALTKLDNIVKMLQYFVGDRMCDLRNDINFVAQYIVDSSQDQKVHNAKIAAKLKERIARKKDRMIKDAEKVLTDIENNTVSHDTMKNAANIIKDLKKDL